MKNEDNYPGKGDPYWDWSHQAMLHLGIVSFTSLIHPLSHWSKRTWIGYRLHPIHGGQYGCNINEGGRHCCICIRYVPSINLLQIYLAIFWWGKWRKFSKYITGVTNARA